MGVVRTPPTHLRRDMDDKTKKAIEKDYQIGISPLGISLKNNVTIAQVYEAIGQPEMNTIAYGGDMVDPGPGINLNGPVVDQINYTKD